MTPATAAERAYAEAIRAGLPAEVARQRAIDTLRATTAEPTTHRPEGAMPDDYDGPRGFRRVDYQ